MSDALMTPGRTIAVVGMAGLFPGSPTPDHFWVNVRDGVDVSRDVPPGRWALPPESVYEPGPARPDRVYSKRGYFLDPFAFDPAGLEIDPGLLARLDPVFHLLLKVGSEAFRSARMDPVDRSRVGVIVGNIALPTEGVSRLAWEFVNPRGEAFPEPTHPLNRFGPGLPAGLLARALGLGAGGRTVDAACASSLYAVKLAVDELLAGRADAMLTGGLNRADPLYTQMGFSQLRALSAGGRCSPLDASADGLIVGEGAGVFVLKRLDDALRHGDTIHGLIRAVGLSNDQGGNLLAPEAEGQLRAMRSAYGRAGWSPADVDLIECHATGTPVGDRVELGSLSELWRGLDGSCVVGSVKSTVGHLLTGAGAAGVMKVLLAMRHGVLPPTANFRRLPDGFEGGPLRASAAAEAWPERGRPRRAAVSAFGFGGVNAHLLIEECDPGRFGTSVAVPEVVTPEPLAVVGMGARFGSCETLNEFREHVLAGTAPDSRTIDALDFPLDRFRIPPLEVEQTLPQQLLTLTVADAALADVRSTAEVSPQRRGAFVGLGLDPNTTNFHLRWLAPESGDGLSPPLTADRVMGSLGSVAASRLARAFRIAGPCFTMSGEEASAPAALRAAADSLRNGELDLALVAAVDFAADPRAASARHSVDPDAGPPGDGAAALVLKRLADAERDGDRIYALVGGPDDSDDGAMSAGVAGFGHCGAAAAMPGLVAAALALHHRTADGRYWLTDDADGPRRAAVRVPSVDGSRSSVVLREHAAPRPGPPAAIVKSKPPGQVAFVYPGSGNHFPGMGRDWAVAFPWVLDRQQAENARLRSQYRPELFWGERIPDGVTPRDLLFGQVTLGTLITDVLVGLGVRPDAAIGYSLGESAALFALRAWRDRDAMLDRVNASSLFADDLAGRCDAVRAHWKLGPGEPVDWLTALLPARADEAGRLIEPGSRVNLLIVNTPNECVVGGSRPEVERLARTLGVVPHPIPGVSVAHCPAVGTVAEAYRDLHRLPVTPPEGVRFYSGAWGRPYDLDSESAAEAILASALDTIDFPALVERAYRDGVRVFVEVGPGPSCSRMIASILKGRPHTTVPMCVRGQGPFAALEKLADAGIDIAPAPQPSEPRGNRPARVLTLRPPFRSGTAPMLDRSKCLEFARGSIAPVLGERFAEVDSYPTRVRLPDEPLMLVDRILSVEGEPLSLKTGRVVTEHDVHAGRWYLENGRAPACVAIESGQADLFLSAYLGIDFRTRGEAVYRLLDAAVTFHRGLPEVGDTLRYDIHIDNFFRQGDTHLFRFRFEGTVNGEPLLTMRDGCAGFFTDEELSSGKGIVERKSPPSSGGRPADWRDLAPLGGPESYSDERIEGLVGGDLAAAFGPAFGHLRDVRTLPGGMMRLVRRVPLLEPRGGKFGLGLIRAEADVRPDDWYLTCHFVDDMVMPGTLMYEGTLYALRVLLMRLGWVGTSGTHWEPKPGVCSRLRCRGQVTRSTRTVAYEVAVKELGYGPEPFAVADAFMYADGKRVVEVTDISLRLAGATRGSVEALWAAPAPPAARPAGATPKFMREQILAFALGKPSDCFGEAYRPFDAGRFFARFPGPPYSFLDRVTRADAEPMVLAPGGSVTAEYDVPAAAWYFGENGSPQMPFAVLQEVALQACGFQAAYMGSAPAADAEMAFRNLGGRATQLRPVTPDTGTLATTVKTTKVSRSAGMIIQNYDFEVRCADGPVYVGDTYFGFFGLEALARQVGMPDAEWPAHGGGPGEPFPLGSPFPGAGLRMIDKIDWYSAGGGRAGLGAGQGSIGVDPSAWFFRAHFLGDPVWPGSLGLESLVQLIKYLAFRRWGDPGPGGWLALAPGREHAWTYRGQVVPAHGRVEVLAEVTGADDGGRELTADGLLRVDGRVIYRMERFSVRAAGGSPG